MIAQAEHIPVHLGAMPDAVAAVLGLDPEPGDVFVLNDPFTGGTHLPDITLVSPVFLPRDRKPTFFVANRAHHSDVGGMSPGSMPVARETSGRRVLIIPPVRLVRAGDYALDVLERSGQHAHSAATAGDFRAQIAANWRGTESAGRPDGPVGEATVLSV
jgi:N-methylhydantoinase B